MDKTKISLSVPATIYDFGEMESLTNNKYVTHAKLKVFYVGETGDRRRFTKEFSDQLLTTLPGTPVVAYFDYESDDFIGHHWEQYVFGYVPETATIEYIQENNKTFALTDVLLFTGREDNIGFIAQQIIGKQHSLELDPKTVEYVMVKTQGEIESITFTKGDFIGLSVLGDDERPAFEGSSFFKDVGDDIKALVASYKEFKEQVELYKSGGKEMENEKTLPSPEDTAVEATEVQTDEVATDETVVDAENVEDSTEESNTEAEENANEIESVDAAEAENSESVESASEQEDASEEEVNASSEEPTEPEVTDEVVSDVENSSEVIVEAQTLEGMEDAREQETEHTTKEKEREVEQNSDSAALNKAERQELNEYRRQAKLALIDSYTELSEETKEEFKAKHAEFTVDQLDKELAYVLVKELRQQKAVNYRVFSVNSSKEETLVDIVNRYKDKN